MKLRTLVHLPFVLVGAAAVTAGVASAGSAAKPVKVKGT
jgi:hypothetical protein